jgi:hypothetical protein
LDATEAQSPACTVFRTLLDEQGNSLDTSLWRSDRDGVAIGGFFQAREGANSAAAD